MALLAWMTQHHATVTIVAYFIFSAVVDSLPQPKLMGNQGYQFLFTFCHKLAGNLSKDTKAQ